MSLSTICDELDMSPGNITFYFPTKEHLLAVLVDMMCDFQWRLMEHEANEGYSSVMALCLELTVIFDIEFNYTIWNDSFVCSNGLVRIVYYCLLFIIAYICSLANRTPHIIMVGAIKPIK